MSHPPPTSHPDSGCLGVFGGPASLSSSPIVSGCTCCCSLPERCWPERCWPEHSLLVSGKRTGLHRGQSVSQSLPHSYQQSTWLLDLQRTRSTIASVERANLWNGVCAQLHASAIRTRWSAESWHRATFCLLPYWLEAVVTRRGSRRSSRGQNRSRSKGTRGVARPTRIC